MHSKIFDAVLEIPCPFSITMENVHFRALHLSVAESSSSPLCLPQRLPIGSAQGDNTDSRKMVTGGQKQEMVNGTPGVYNPFSTLNLLFLIYF